MAYQGSGDHTSQNEISPLPTSIEPASKSEFSQKESGKAKISRFITRIFKIQNGGTVDGQERATAFDAPYERTQMKYLPSRNDSMDTLVDDDDSEQKGESADVIIRDLIVRPDNDEEENDKGNPKMDSLGILIRGRASIKGLESAQCLARRDGNWNFSRKSSDKISVMGKSRSEMDKQWAIQEIMVERVVSPPSPRDESLRAHLDWLRANHPFLRR